MQFHNTVINWGDLSLTFRHSSASTVLQTPDIVPPFSKSLTLHTLPPLHLDCVSSNSSNNTTTPDGLQTECSLEEKIGHGNPFRPSIAKRVLQHLRFGHRNYADLRKLERHEMVTGIRPALPPDHTSTVITTLDCEACAMGKSRRTSFPRQRKPREYAPLERICFDTCGPFPVNSLNGEKYFIPFQMTVQDTNLRIC